MKACLVFLVLAIPWTSLYAKEYCELEEVVRIENMGMPLENGHSAIQKLWPFLRKVPIKTGDRTFQMHGPDYTVMYEAKNDKLWVGVSGGYVDSIQWYGPIKTDHSVVEKCEKVAAEIGERRRECLRNVDTKSSEWMRHAQECQ